MTSLHIWHLQPDAPRVPRRVSAGERVQIRIGTWPIGPSQSVRVRFDSDRRPGTEIGAHWQRNDGENSYWTATIGPFEEGERVEYTVRAVDRNHSVSSSSCAFEVGPKVHLALLWHQHQPLYRVASPTQRRPVLRQPWVRLHAIRDYYSMAAIVEQYPGVHVTVNFSGVLWMQIDDYVERDATDRHLALTRRAAEELSPHQREELLGSFFDADWHHQIFVHPRYRELFNQRIDRKPFSVRDLRDLQMWSNLAWFGKEFRDGPVELITQETVKEVSRLVRKDRGFTVYDIESMIEEQRKILRAIRPIHTHLSDSGQIEVSTTPFFHPILPLIIDSDDATVDRQGAELPRRFAYPKDAEEQVSRAVADCDARMGRSTRGMWPAEGAVSTTCIDVFARHGIAWISTDRGVLARSGRWGYDVDNPDVLCQPYAATSEVGEVAVFFRDTELSDAIGFHLKEFDDPEDAVDRFIEDIHRLVEGFEGEADRILTVALDGENAWGGYADDGRPFLHALYRRLEGSRAIRTVSPSEYLVGNRGRNVVPHSPSTSVYRLATASWIDETGSDSGNDLGTWIGEPAENKAWEQLREAREAIATSSSPGRPAAMECVYAAEGSDWFWWYGDDQSSGNDESFDRLFRDHLASIYDLLGLPCPDDVRTPAAGPPAVWTFARPLPTVRAGRRLTIRTNCPGRVMWREDDGPERSMPSKPIGGVMAGARRFEARLPEVGRESDYVRFRFLCEERGCRRRDICCREGEQAVRVVTQ